MGLLKFLVLSAVSVIEIGVKHATGRLKLKSSPDQFVDELKAEGTAILSVTVGHALRMVSHDLRRRRSRVRGRGRVGLVSAG